MEEEELQVEETFTYVPRQFRTLDLQRPGARILTGEEHVPKLA